MEFAHIVMVIAIVATLAGCDYHNAADVAKLKANQSQIADLTKRVENESKWTNYYQSRAIRAEALAGYNSDRIADAAERGADAQEDTDYQAERAADAAEDQADQARLDALNH